MPNIADPITELRTRLLNSGGSLEELRLLEQVRREREALIRQVAGLDPTPPQPLPRGGELSVQVFLRREGWTGAAFYGTRSWLIEPQPTLLSVCRVACAWWLSFRLRVT